MDKVIKVEHAKAGVPLVKQEVKVEHPVKQELKVEPTVKREAKTEPPTIVGKRRRTSADADAEIKCK